MLTTQQLNISLTSFPCSHHDDRKISVAVMALLLGLPRRGQHQYHGHAASHGGGGPDYVLALAAVGGGEEETILLLRVVLIENSTAGTEIPQSTSTAHHDPQCSISRDNGSGSTPWW